MSLIELLQGLLDFKIFMVLESIALMVVFLYFFHGKVTRNQLGEKRAYFLHFFAAFVLFFVVPIMTLWVFGKSPVDYGLKIGHFRLGMIYSGIGLGVGLLISFFSSRNEEISRFYPFSKASMNSGRDFWIYESAYLLFYYSGWEFLFRGVLLFALAEIDPMLGITLQVIPSALLHIGHPQSETWGAVIGGILFGWIAYSTGSVFYSWLIHAGLGISLDFFIYRKAKRRLS